MSIHSNSSNYKYYDYWEIIKAMEREYLVLSKYPKLKKLKGPLKEMIIEHLYKTERLDQLRHYPKW